MLPQNYFLRPLLISSCLFVFGCGSSNKGLDTRIDTSSLKAFGEKCGEAYADMKEINPKEFQLLKDAGYIVFDLSQPKDQVMFQSVAGNICAADFGTVQKAALESNVNVKTFREIKAYQVKSAIDDAVKIFNNYKSNANPNTPPSIQGVMNKYLTDSVEKIRKLQPLYQGLTGQPYGPKKLEAENGDLAKPTELPLTQKPTEQPITQPAPVAAPNPAQAPVAEKVQPSPQASWSPSFDCAKASTFSEKAICTDTLLGKLDGALAENYKHMLASDIGDGARNDLKATQRRWLAERNKCTDNQCLASAYRKRIDEVCEYPVISGAHPVCTNSDEIK